MQALCCCEIQQLAVLSSQEWMSREVGLVWWLKERGVGRATPPDQQEPPTRG